MRVAVVLLRLVGPTSLERVHSWARALGEVTGDCVLDLSDTELSDAEVIGPEGTGPEVIAEADDRITGLVTACGVRRGNAVRADVLLLADAAALPTPTSLRRLVAASLTAGPRTIGVLGTRVLPYGARVLADGSQVPSPYPLVAIAPHAPATCASAGSPAEALAAATEAGGDVPRAEDCAVFVGRPDPDAALSAQPWGHPGALPATALHRLLLATAVEPPPATTADHEPPELFLSVLTRTQGTRIQCLEEVLTCLAGQTNRDFEVLLACHRVDAAGLAAVRGVLGRLPAWLAERTRLLEVERPGRSAPLNAALDVARGRYAVMLDDDDAVTDSWVASFAALEAQHPGVVLRSAALAQDVRPVPVIDEDGPRGPAPVEVGAARTVWPDEFRMTDHLWDNASPPMTFAVPRGVYGALGHRFDESLDTTEDWDFLMRAASITGVASTPEVTATYRVWTSEEGSRHLHDAEHWAMGREAVVAGLDERPIVLAPGAAREVRDLQSAREEECAEKFRFAELNERAADDLRTVNDAVVALRERIAVLEERLARARQRARKN